MFYSTHKKKWSVNELLTLCFQEEGRLNQKRIENEHLATQEKKPDKKGKSKTKAPFNQVNKGVVKYFFSKKKGYMNKNCPKFKAWLEKKGNLISLMCYESNMVHVSHNTWWIDSATTIHIVNTMQGFLNQRNPTKSECSIYSGNQIGLLMKAFDTYRLVFRSGFVLDLERTFYVLFFPLEILFQFQDLYSIISVLISLVLPFIG